MGRPAGRTIQFRRKYQRHQNQDTADGSDDVLEREEADLRRVQASEATAHGLASGAVGAGAAGVRSIRRSFETTCEWQ